MTAYPPYASVPVPKPETLGTRLKRVIICPVVFIALMWGVYVVNVAVQYRLFRYSIQPLDLSSLWHIFTAPFLHGGFAHLTGNTVPAAIFGSIIALSGRRVFVEVTLIAMVIGGLGTWFFGGVGTYHVGASGVIYGWLAYLIVRGVFNRSLSQTVLGVVLAFAYSGWVWGFLPNSEGISWQGHLFGAIGGVLAGATISSDDPPALRAKKEQRRLERARRKQQQTSTYPMNQQGNL